VSVDAPVPEVNTSVSTPLTGVPVSRPATQGGAEVVDTQSGWSLTPYVVVFLSSVAIMIIELLAGRLVGRHLGSSLYTWTSIIGVIMAGMSVGNYWGGCLADRHAPRRLLPWMLVSSAGACLFSLLLNHLMAGYLPLPITHWPSRIFLTVLIVFSLPAVALGTITPVAAKIAVQQRSRHVGGSIGTLYALSALGSIFGTFLTGYYLVMIIGVTPLVLMTMGGLLAMGAVLYLTMGGEAEAGPVEEEKRAPEGAVQEGASFWTRYEAQAIVFCSAASLMAMEIVASRLVARHLGSSIYTWTSIIGVVLAGMTVGYFMGGALADRWSPERYIGLLCTLASAACVTALMIGQCLHDAAVLSEFNWPTRVFLTVLSSFLVPSLLLGVISPSAAKLALNRSRQVGTTIGAVYAWGTVGSIVGTLSTGFFLISALTANGVVLAASILLALVGWVVGPHRMVATAWVAVLAPLMMCASMRDDQVSRRYRTYAENLGLRMNTEGRFFSRESDYQYIKVHENEKGSSIRKLVLDHLVHGYVDMRNPGHLEYDYEKVYADVAKRYAEGKPTVSAFFLGGGSFTFQRWTQHVWPDAHIEVAEIDPMVVEANHVALGLPRDTNMRIHVGDARNVIDSLPADAKFDFFFGDAFNDFSVPWHLTTIEFNRKIAARLTPGGAYLMNVIDDFRSGLFLGACYMTLRNVFPYVYIFCTEQNGVNDRRDTFVVAASHTPIDISDWMPNHFTDFEGSALTPKDFDALEEKCGGRVLTDELAPVENLLAPVVRVRRN
jgi:spermidine synthase